MGSSPLSLSLLFLSTHRESNGRSPFHYIHVSSFSSLSLSAETKRFSFSLQLFPRIIFCLSVFFPLILSLFVVHWFSILSPSEEEEEEEEEKIERKKEKSTPFFVCKPHTLERKLFLFLTARISIRQDVCLVPFNYIQVELLSIQFFILRDSGFLFDTLLMHGKWPQCKDHVYMYFSGGNHIILTVLGFP